MSRNWSSVKIIHYPDPRLHKPCRAVERFDHDLAALARRMLELMHAHKGVGLAAPQVGELVQMFVCNLTGDTKDDQVFVNPALSDLEGEIEAQEGCLSIPDVSVTMRRATSARLQAQDLSGKRVELTGADLAVRCWQHECDHLRGRLIVDAMSESDRIANRRALKDLERKFKKRAVAL